MKRLIAITSIFLLVFLSETVNAQIPKLNSFPQQVNAVIFLDFDGQTVSSAYWTATPFYATPALLTNDQINRIFNQVSEDFRPFNLNITTDSTVYFAAPINRRQRIIVTNYSSWYGNAGGVAYNPSFRWGLEVPGFVFSNLLNNNAKMVSEACSHETGHTLGLNHQKIYNSSCGLTAEYNPGIGSGETSWAPIMGNSYSRNLTLWHNGTSLSCNNLQDELSIIGNSANNQNGFGTRSDDIGNTINLSANIIFNGSTFGTSGYVNSSSDIDMFRVSLNQNGRLVLTASPYNVSNGFQSANIDLQVSLLNSIGNVIKVYNPSTTLQAVIDSTLNAGTYFVKLSSVTNDNVSNYGMLGNYTVSGTFQAGATLPIHSLQLSGRIANEKHELDWNIIADEPVETITVEVSADGRTFTNLQDINGSLRKFIYQPFEKATMYYRLHVVTASQLTYYSNIVSLREVNASSKYKLLSNLVTGNSIVVNSKGNFNWKLIDMNGRNMQSGRISNGYNRIDAASLSSGMYLLQVIDGAEISTEKLVKH